jgi:methionyl-tRNA synthetase
MSASTFFITTAIDYTNAAPHIGHAYEKILADVIARYHRLKGERVYFLTGVDQHGQKVQQAAQREGVAPREFAERVTAKFLALWEKLGIAYDCWAATTDERHKHVVQQILQTLHDRGDLYKSRHAGFYSVRQEQFLTEKERGLDGEFGPQWGEVIQIEEENWYFRLTKHRDWLAQFVNTHPQWVTPNFRHAELRNAVEKLSGDLSISRPRSRLGWGIELPFDHDYVTYVWFDALINYISFAGYRAKPSSGLPDFGALWPCNAHVIGKDILIPAHGIYWPIMLHALGFSDEEIPPLLVHGYVNIGGAKMSKSLGNIIDPDLLADRYGAETLRYYLMRDCAVGYDMDFSEERLIQRYNTDLANDLGNLVNRTLNMAYRYRDGVLRRAGGDESLRELGQSTVAEFQRQMERFEIQAALATLWNLISSCNGFVEKTAPWKLAKDRAQAARLDAVLFQLAESLRVIAIVLSPVMPQASAAMLQQLGVSEKATLPDAISRELPDAHSVGTPHPIFPRLEVASI